MNDPDFTEVEVKELASLLRKAADALEAGDDSVTDLMERVGAIAAQAMLRVLTGEHDASA